jgi:copper chaperone CopZ
VKRIQIAGMSCQHCVMAVTKALSAVDGIKDIRVDLKTGIATYDEVKPVDESVVATAIRKAGYNLVG